MKILLAGPRGFCAGVNMAIETLETAIRLHGTPIYVFHEIVHNKHVVNRFVREGAVFVDSVEEVPEGAVLLFSRTASRRRCAAWRPHGGSTRSTPPARSSRRSISRR